MALHVSHTDRKYTILVSAFQLIQLLLFFLFSILFKSKVMCFMNSESDLWFGEMSRDGNLTRFRYVTCHDSLSKTIRQGTLEGGWRHGRYRKCWMDNAKERPNCSQWPATEKTGNGSLLNHLSCLPLPMTTQSMKGLNWTSETCFTLIWPLQFTRHYIYWAFSITWHFFQPLRACF